MAGPDYIVDIDGLKPPAPPNAQRADRVGLRGRRWLAVQWKCCSVYSRIYCNQAGTMYEGKCPRCGKPVSAKVGPGGTSKRFFEAS